MCFETFCAVLKAKSMVALGCGCVDHSEAVSVAGGYGQTDVCLALGSQSVAIRASTERRKSRQNVKGRVVPAIRSRTVPLVVLYFSAYDDDRRLKSKSKDRVRTASQLSPCAS